MGAVSGIVMQQALAQTNAGMSMLKQAAQADQALVNMVAQSAASGGRGQNLDLSV